MSPSSEPRQIRWRRVAATLIIAVVVLAHIFRLGRLFHGEAHSLYYSYFSDFALPLAAYFVLVLAEAKNNVLNPWYVKAAIVFGLATLDEIAQGLGIGVLGTTFDAMDILAYAAGTVIAVGIDRVVLGRWKS